jgi:adenosylhomocysteine nucleosidase
LTDPVVGVACALRNEARHLVRPAPRLTSVQRLPDGKLLALTGMGPAAATAGAERLIAAGAGALVSWGLAGGLDPELAAGTIFLPSEVATAEGVLLATDARWRERLGTTLTRFAPLTSGRLVTVAAVVATPAAKAALFNTSGARAVDMESAAIAEVARRRALPFIAVRVIIDRAGDAMPDSFVAAFDANGDFSLWRLLAQLLRSPGELGSVMRLAGIFHQANRALAAVAASDALARPQRAQAATDASRTAGAT